MANQKYIHTLIWILAIVWAVLLIINGFDITLEFFKPISTVTGIGILIIGLFERWIWEWRWLHPWFVSVPNIAGTWQGQIISDWIDEANMQKKPPIEAYIIIRQTFSSIQVKLVTQESSSELIDGKLFKNNGIVRLTGVYMNISKQAYRDKSPIHYGGIFLEICENDSVILEGYYWTDRKSRGDLYFKNKVKSICSNFEDCKKIFSKLKK